MRNFWQIVFVIGSYLLCPHALHAITIDSFDGAQEVSTSGANPNDSDVTAAPGSIGGTRSMLATSSGVLNLSVKTQSGFLSHSQEANVAGQSVISWDGDTTPDFLPPSSPAGLGGIDLTQDGGDAFRLLITSFDYPSNRPISFTVYVFDASAPIGNRYSSATETLNSAINNFTLEIPFANFTKGPTAVAAASFTNVGAIVLLIDGSNPDVDLTIDHFSTNGECDIVPVNGNASKDACGVCGGNNQSCADCLGVPNGSTLPGAPCDTGDIGICSSGHFNQNCICTPDSTPGPEQCDGLDNDCDGQIDEVLDVCGVCGGDGTSCLDCAGTVNGSAVVDTCGVCGGDNTSCFKCEVVSTPEISFELDHGAKLQEKLIKDMVKQLLRRDTSRRTVKYTEKVLPLAHSLQNRNWILSWTLPPKIYQCNNQTLCFEKSNLDILTEYRTHNQELHSLATQVIKRIAKKRISTKKYIKRNDTLRDTNHKTSLRVPESTSVCVTYPST